MDVSAGQSASNLNAQGTGEGPSGGEGGQASASPPPAKKVYRVKVDGQEQEVDEDTLVRDYQFSAASRKRFSEADLKFKEAEKKERQAEETRQALAKGDLDYIKRNFPKDVFKKVATDFLLEEIEWDSLPESEKRRIQAERRAEEAESKLSAKDKAEQEAKEKTEYDTRYQSYQKELDAGFGEAIKSYKDQGVFIDHAHMHRALQILENSIRIKQPIKPTDALKLAVEEDSVAYNKRLTSFGVEDLIKTLPKEKIDQLRKHFVEQARNKLSETTKSDDGKVVTRKKQEKLGMEEWFKRLDQRFTGS